RRRHTRSKRDWSSDVCSSDLLGIAGLGHIGADLGDACVDVVYALIEFAQVYSGHLTAGDASRRLAESVRNLGKAFCHIIHAAVGLFELIADEEIINVLARRERQCLYFFETIVIIQLYNIRSQPRQTFRCQKISAV